MRVVSPNKYRLFLQLSLAPDAFLVPECWLELAPNVVEVAHTCVSSSLVSVYSTATKTWSRVMFDLLLWNIR